MSKMFLNDQIFSLAGKCNHKLRIASFILFGSLLVTLGSAQAGVLLGSNFDDDLFSIDASNGSATLIGNSGVDGAGKGLAFDPINNQIFAISTRLGELYSVNQSTGTWTSIGGDFDSPSFPGLTFNSSTGSLFGSESDLQELFSIDTNTGARTSIGGTSVRISGLAYDANHDILFGAGSDNQLYNVNMADGVLTAIGDLGINAFNVGLAYDYDLDVLYLNSSETDSLYTISANTGLASLVGNNAIGGGGNIQGLTYVGSLSVPAPAPLALLGLGLLGLGTRRKFS